jgi:hypothetical protein
MQLPLNFLNIILWLGITAMILLVTAQLVLSYEGPQSILADERKIENAGILVGILFLITIAIRIFGLIA